MVDRVFAAQQNAAFNALEQLQFGSPSGGDLGSLWQAASGFWDNEGQQVAAIRRHLLTPGQRQRLFDLDLSIEDLLNGRVEGANQDAVYAEFFDAWNATLGYRAFGF